MTFEESGLLPVEWLFRDAMDAKKDFEGACIWMGDCALGTKLRPGCLHWTMFKRLADPHHAGQFLQPPKDYDFAKYFQDMMNSHLGEVREVWGEWVYFEGSPPLSKSAHHGQYATTDEQRAQMDSWGCRGREFYKKTKHSPSHHGASPKAGMPYWPLGDAPFKKVDWEAQADLTLDALLAIGSTSICGGVSSISTLNGHHHWRRRAYVVTYNRLLCSLLGQQRIGMYEAEAWWKNARSICLHKDRQEICFAGLELRRCEGPAWGPQGQGGAKGQPGGPKGKGNGQPKGTGHGLSRTDTGFHTMDFAHFPQAGIRARGQHWHEDNVDSYGQPRR
jgi:hypothetical protein